MSHRPRATTNISLNGILTEEKSSWPSVRSVSIARSERHNTGSDLEGGTMAQERAMQAEGRARGMQSSNNPNNLPGDFRRWKKQRSRRRHAEGASQAPARTA